MSQKLDPKDLRFLKTMGGRRAYRGCSAEMASSAIHRRSPDRCNQDASLVGSEDDVSGKLWPVRSQSEN